MNKIDKEVKDALSELIFTFINYYCSKKCDKKGNCSECQLLKFNEYLDDWKVSK